METFLLVVAGILTVVGVLGNLIPGVPGTPLNFIALLILHFVRGGEVFSTGALLVLGLFTIAALVLDYVFPIMAAKRFGATKYGIWGSVIGMIAGFLVFNIIGMIIGMVAGAVVGELIAGKKHGEALSAGIATLIGNVIAAVVRLGVSMAMALLFFVKLFW